MMIVSTERNGGISKLRDLMMRRQRQESDGGISGEEVSELDFTYDDADLYTNEISELYSYTESPEFRKHLTSYEHLLTSWGFCLQWQKLSQQNHTAVILRLLNYLELSNKNLRNDAAKAILYIAQGCWNEIQSDQEQVEWTRRNVVLLIKNGIFQAVVELLSLEIE